MSYFLHCHLTFFTLSQLFMRVYYLLRFLHLFRDQQNLIVPLSVVSSDFSPSSNEGRKNLNPFGCLLLGGTQFFLRWEELVLGSGSSSEDRVIISIPFRSYCSFIKIIKFIYKLMYCVLDFNLDKVKYSRVFQLMVYCL